MKTVKAKSLLSWRPATCAPTKAETESSVATFQARQKRAAELNRAIESVARASAEGLEAAAYVSAKHMREIGRLRRWKEKAQALLREAGEAVAALEAIETNAEKKKRWEALRAKVAKRSHSCRASAWTVEWAKGIFGATKKADVAAERKPS